MKIGKLFVAGALAISVSLLVSACGIFESGADEEKDALWTDVAKENANKSASSDATTAHTASTNANDPSFSTVDSNKLGPGDFGTTNEMLAGSGYIDSVGPRVPGVNFGIVYFGFDDSSISSSELPKIYEIADYLSGAADQGVVIEGNCDERGSKEYNRALGEKRAISAKLILMERGIAESRIKVISYGEERPAQLGNNESAWSMNRRAEFVPVYLK